MKPALPKLQRKYGLTGKTIVEVKLNHIDEISG
jgi:hypothetical protein